MKKLTTKLLLLMLLLTMAFSMAACGTKSNDGSMKDSKAEDSLAADDEDDEDEKTDDKDDEETDDNGNEKTDDKSSALYDSVADYVNSDEMQAALQTLRDSQGEGIDINIVAEDENKMVYIFTYKTIAHTEGDGMTESLEQAIATQDATFQQTANSVAPFVGGGQVTVEIRYVDMNGAVIFSKSYVSE